MKGAAAILSTLLLLGATGCTNAMPVDFGQLGFERLSDEEQIAQVLNDVQRGFENRRIFKVLAHIAPSYADPSGRDYNELRELLTDRMKQYREIKITRTQPRIRVQGETARVLETFGVIGKPLDPVENDTLNIQGQVAVYLARHESRWLIVGWERVQ